MAFIDLPEVGIIVERCFELFPYLEIDLLQKINKYGFLLNYWRLYLSAKFYKLNAHLNYL